MLFTLLLTNAVHMRRLSEPPASVSLLNPTGAVVALALRLLLRRLSLLPPPLLLLLFFVGAGTAVALTKGPATGAGPTLPSGGSCTWGGVTVAAPMMAVIAGGSLRVVEGPSGASARLASALLLAAAATSYRSSSLYVSHVCTPSVSAEPREYSSEPRTKMAAPKVCMRREPSGHAAIPNWPPGTKPSVPTTKHTPPSSYNDAVAIAVRRQRTDVLWVAASPPVSPAARKAETKAATAYSVEPTAKSSSPLVRDSSGASGGAAPAATTIS